MGGLLYEANTRWAVDSKLCFINFSFHTGVYFETHRGGIIFDRASMVEDKLGIHCNSTFELDPLVEDAARNVMVLYTHPIFSYMNPTTSQ